LRCLQHRDQPGNRERWLQAVVERAAAERALNSA
jgi:hypothetical protein